MDLESVYRSRSQSNSTDSEDFVSHCKLYTACAYNIILWMKILNDSQSHYKAWLNILECSFSMYSMLNVMLQYLSLTEGDGHERGAGDSLVVSEFEQTSHGVSTSGQYEHQWRTTVWVIVGILQVEGWGLCVLCPQVFVYVHLNKLYNNVHDLMIPSKCKQR